MVLTFEYFSVNTIITIMDFGDVHVTELYPRLKRDNTIHFIPQSQAHPL